MKVGVAIEPRLPGAAEFAVAAEELGVARDVFFGPLTEGAARSGRVLSDLDLVAPVAVEFHETDQAAAEAARRHADGYAFTIGAMGAAGRNFYNEAFARLGYGAEVARVAELWATGRRDEARAAVPLDLGRLTNLVGTTDQVAQRVSAYRAAGITTLLVKLDGSFESQLRTLERLLTVVG